ncbi:hypothetical protein PPTG_23962 [Phytophthora nicotianae INRA-310]|uniref:Peptidase A2 domain-containing protein n=1 Tax=Phytophthora nicotianae (strain INRA-310) TaxID=761204 RepID=W2PMV7_PHYN3|nr:hypothetical protein PPTG_23962 [Phytophthora nicotianae INRA-310]ETN01961.1 hypothetical protein PPTG_23962 [Phytophthora nicotianae INRA-310]
MGEAKRANRDFREVGGSVGTSLPVVSTWSSDKDESTGTEVPTGDEEGREFMQNVCVGLDGTAALVSWNPELEAGTMPFRWRSIIRNRVYEHLKRERHEEKSPHRRGPRALESDGAEDDVPPLRDKEAGDCLDEESLREYLNDVGGTKKVAFLDLAVSWARRYCEEGADVVAEEAPEVYRVSASRAPRRPRKPGLREADAGDDQEGDDDVVPQGKRVICSVVGMQALSDGYIDCCPLEMLADTGAIANSVSGHAIRVSGGIDLPVTLGTLEKTLLFVVTDHLFVDAILGTDSLKAFRAVIALEERTMTLKGTGDVTPLGVTRVEETLGRKGTPDPGGTAAWNATDVAVPVGEALEAAIPGELQGGDQLANPSPVDVFGLEYTKFVAGLERVPYLEALKVSLIPIAVRRDYEARFGITGHLCLKWCEAYAIWLHWASSYKCVRATGEAAVTVVDGIGDWVVCGYLLASLMLSILIYLPRLIYESIKEVQRGWMGVLLVVLILDTYMEFTVECGY